MFGEAGAAAQMREVLLGFGTTTVVVAVLLTLAAYGVFFGQCTLLAHALGIPLSYLTVSYAISLGSLVTLIPISVSGLGTREATIIAYLATVGVAAEEALGFSLLVFATFYLGGGGLGAIAWWLKPADLAWVREARNELG